MPILQAPHPQAPHPQAPDPQAPDPQAPDPQAPDPQALHLDDAVRIWFRFLRLSTRIRFAVAEKLKTLGISVSQCDVLSTLTEAEGLSQQDLATRLYVTKGNISGLVDRLAEAGLVERRATTADRRSHAIFLTDAGRRIAAEGIALQREFVARTFGRLPPDQRLAFEATLIEVRNLVRRQIESD